jgi:hypothetical protein
MAKGTETRMNINRRKSYRKSVDITGTLVVGKKLYTISITDMSLYGIHFNILKNTVGISVNDEVIITYTLPNKKLTEVKELIKIRRVYTKGTGQWVGAEIILLNLYSSQQKNKGFFLR